MVIIGAGGHASEVLDVILERNIPKTIYFFDNLGGELLSAFEYPVIRSFDELREVFPGKFEFILGIGNPQARQTLFKQFEALGGIYKPLVSVSASVSHKASGTRYDLMKNTYIGPGVNIGQGTLINTGAQVHHGCLIGEFTEISPRALLLGACSIGDLCSIGANATILPRVNVCDNVVIGAGAVVTNDIFVPGTYAGVPAKRKK